MSNLKLSFTLADYVILAQLPTLDEPSSMGNFTRTAFNDHHQVIGEIESIEGVHKVEQKVGERCRYLLVTCSADNLPYYYMQQIQQVAREFGYYREGQKGSHYERQSTKR